jgi:hypothetical protein
MSELATLEAAQENLRIREGTAHQQIHATRSSKQVMEVNADPTTVIRSWLRTRPHLKAAIWTGLETNWEQTRGCQFTPDNASLYISELMHEQALDPTRYARAREYIQNAPAQIQTRVRRMLRANGLEDAKLPAELFETKESDDPCNTPRLCRLPRP